MDAHELLALFDDAAAAQRAAVATISALDRRDRTERRGQYRLDVVADAAVVPVLLAAGVRVLSEESGWSGPDDAAITVVVDPVDGSTNCSRGLPYWAISLCALDAEGPLCSLVQNSVTEARYAAVRGEGATLDGVRVHASPVTEIERAVVALAGTPTRVLRWRQYRALGSAALALCDLAAGRLDGYLDGTYAQHAPWDYLGAQLVCEEAGALIGDADGRPLVELGFDVRRRIVAAATPELFDVLHAGMQP